MALRTHLPNVGAASLQPGTRAVDDLTPEPRINRAGRALILIEIARFGLKAKLCDGQKRFTNSGRPKSLARALRYGMLY
jgi:hypothetical protein